MSERTPSSISRSSTSSSLLERVRQRDEEAWRRLVKLYGPAVYEWCRRAGLQPDDAADIAQEVFRSVSSNIETYRHDRPGDSFRGWLWVIAKSKLNDYFREQRGEVTAAGGSAMAQQLDQIASDEDSVETDGAVCGANPLFRRALELIKSEFEPRTWDAFWRVVVDEESPAEVAGKLGMTAAAVRKAKSRILKRLRAELEGLLPPIG